MNQPGLATKSSIFADELDASQQHLLQEMASLITISDSKFARCFSALLAHIEQEFYAEEEWMEDVGFPAILPHREQHSRVLSALHHVHPRVMAGDLVAGRQAARLLFQWFMNHMSSMDRALISAVQMTVSQANRKMPSAHYA